MPDSSDFYKDKTILITGGAGSLGQELVRRLLQTEARKIVVFSRDEYKQWLMASEYEDQPRLRFYIGDVRDYRRVMTAFHSVDYVIHAAALKHVPALERNPFEAVQTNIMGARNVIEAALERGVSRVVAVSTDKACAPINLYGATKLVAEKLFLNAHSYRGDWPTSFSVVRYGNVMDSRGGVLSLWRDAETLMITNGSMTRFWMTLAEAGAFILRALECPRGLLMVPKLPSFHLSELLDAFLEVWGARTVKTLGIRAGEKMHESLISAEEARSFRECDWCYYLTGGEGRGLSGIRSDCFHMSREELRRRMAECLKPE